MLLLCASSSCSVHHGGLAVPATLLERAEAALQEGSCSSMTMMMRRAGLCTARVVLHTSLLRSFGEKLLMRLGLALEITGPVRSNEEEKNSVGTAEWPLIQQLFADLRLL